MKIDKDLQLDYRQTYLNLQKLLLKSLMSETDKEKRKEIKDMIDIVGEDYKKAINKKGKKHV